MILPATVLDSPLVHRVGWTLLHSLWQGAAVFAALLIALAGLRKSRAQARYVAACAAMSLLAAAPVVTFFLTSPPVSVRRSAETPATTIARQHAVARVDDLQSAPRAVPIPVEVVSINEQESRPVDSPHGKPPTSASQPSAKASLSQIQHRLSNWVIVLAGQCAAILN